jgi:hypothetical protein
MLATPILANLAWKIFQVTEDMDFLETVFPKLLDFIQTWFTDSQDRDSDGLPEWGHPAQSGFDENPLFSLSTSSFMTGDITKVESPSLCSFLYNEIKILLEMARLLGQTSPVATLETLSENLKTAVNTSWDESASIYRYWDRESHFTSEGEMLGERLGSGDIVISRTFQTPVRLVFRITSQHDNRKDIRIFIHGAGKSGNQKIEKIETDQILWHLYQANATSEWVYSSVDYIEVSGASANNTITVGVMDLSRRDQTLLLPLWAGIPDEKQASKLIKNTICNSRVFWKAYGIPASPVRQTTDVESPTMVHMIWNSLIGEALIKYGFRKEAADLVSRLMGAAVTNLQKYGALSSFYDPATGSGKGERNTLRGLVPSKLFLDTLGVQIISPTKVILDGKNPFPWPVTIHYRGLTINRESQKTMVSFPGGQTAVIKSEEPRVIQMELS